MSKAVKGSTEPSPYVMRKTRVAYVSVLGKIWMPAVTAAMEYKLDDYALRNIGKFTRDNVEQWLAMHAGDFQSIIDFTAQCGDTMIPWKDEESEYKYVDCMFPDED